MGSALFIPRFGIAIPATFLKANQRPCPLLSTDWLGQPKTVHADAGGNVTGESHEETDLLGRRQTVRYDK